MGRALNRGHGAVVTSRPTSGSIRRGCVGHVLVLGERQLREVLKSYARYDKSARTHHDLAKDAPISRPVQRIGHIVSHALVGGLHHQRPNLSFRHTQATGCNG